MSTNYPNNFDLLVPRLKDNYDTGGSIPISATGKEDAIKNHVPTTEDGDVVSHPERARGKPFHKPDEPTIGSQEFDNSLSPSEFIKRFDPTNKSGVIPFGLDLMKQLKMGMSPDKLLSDIVGSKLNGLLNQFSQINQIKEMLSNVPDLKNLLSSVEGSLSNQIQKEFSNLNDFKDVKNIISNSLKDKLNSIDTKNISENTVNEVYNIIQNTIDKESSK